MMRGALIVCIMLLFGVVSFVVADQHRSSMDEEEWSRTSASLRESQSDREKMLVQQTRTAATAECPIPAVAQVQSKTEPPPRRRVTRRTHSPTPRAVAAVATPVAPTPLKKIYKKRCVTTWDVTQKKEKKTCR